jgi:ribulose-5-phosphate 4-epimerase/fuculose-1-phosphate aldolase
MTDVADAVLRQQGESALGIELTPEQEVALLARMLWEEGYDDHVFGHISYRQSDGTLLVNPSNLAWRQVTASDVVRLAKDGSHISGRRVAPAAIELHVALHARRDDVAVAVHNHPRWGTIWSAVGRIPPVYEQVGAWLGEADIGFQHGYQGVVIDPVVAASNVEGLGTRSAVLLENHGVFVVGEDVRQAHQRCVALESRSRIAWHVETLGGGKPMPADQAENLASLVKRTRSRNLFDAAARWEIDRDPSVLD